MRACSAGIPVDIVEDLVQCTRALSDIYRDSYLVRCGQFSTGSATANRRLRSDELNAHRDRGGALRGLFRYPEGVRPSNLEYFCHIARTMLSRTRLLFSGRNTMNARAETCGIRFVLVTKYAVKAAPPRGVNPYRGHRAIASLADIRVRKSAHETALQTAARSAPSA